MHIVPAFRKHIMQFTTIKAIPSSTNSISMCGIAMETAVLKYNLQFIMSLFIGIAIILIQSAFIEKQNTAT